jgi:uncharacterized membrane protein required for colicin V production
LGELFGGETVASVVIFILIFLISSRLVGFLFHVLEKTFHLLSFVPFLKSINRLVGGLFGFFEGVILIGAIIFFSQAYAPAWLLGVLDDSEYSSYASGVFEMFVGLIPEDLSALVEEKEAELMETVEGVDWGEAAERAGEIIDAGAPLLKGGE